MVKRIHHDRCCGLIIDVQKYFLSQLDRRHRSGIVANTRNLVRLLDHFKIPVVVTLERPIEKKGVLPREIAAHLGPDSKNFEKDFFDLSKEKTIEKHLARLRRKQMIVAGCETDVCVLQSCLGLLNRGYEVYVMEELLFSSSRDVSSALVRMQNEGAVFLTYKTLYYELIESVGADSLPRDLPDAIVTPKAVKKA
jgi:nicotinamidase-related amidase